jgi:hypothetical protein
MPQSTKPRMMIGSNYEKRTLTTTQQQQRQQRPNTTINPTKNDNMQKIGYQHQRRPTTTINQTKGHERPQLRKKRQQ